MNDPAPDDFIVGEKDLGVRKWLMNIMMDAGGIQCQWVSILDRYGITCVKFGHSTLFNRGRDFKPDSSC